MRQSFEGDPDTSNERSNEIEKLSYFVERAQSVLNGEVVYADAMHDEALPKALAEAETSGEDISHLRTEVESILEQLPQAEMKNILTKEESALQGFDPKSAGFWHYEFDGRIKRWEENGALDSSQISELQKRHDELGAELTLQLDDVGMAIRMIERHNVGVAPVSGDGPITDPTAVEESIRATLAFRTIDRKFNALEETGTPLSFEISDEVLAPLSRDSSTMSAWHVVRAENGHYFLETDSATMSGRKTYLFCSEEELKEWGN